MFWSKNTLKHVTQKHVTTIFAYICACKSESSRNWPIRNSLSSDLESSFGAAKYIYLKQTYSAIIISNFYKKNEQTRP